VYARDIVYGEDLKDAKVSFECMRFRCDLGTTRSELNGIKRITTEFPAGCYGGFVVAEKEGYTTARQQVEGTEQTLELEMIPLRKVYYTVDLAKVGTIPVPLESHQTAYVTLKSNTLKWDKSFVYDPTEQNYLEVLDLGEEYNVSVMVYGNNGLVGGYIGKLSADQSSQRLTLHAFEEVPHPTAPEQVGNLLKFLRYNTSQYHGDYYPVWH
jgi:hypothetical protein